MDEQGYGNKIRQEIESIPYGVAIFSDQIARSLAEQLSISIEKAQKMTNLNLKRLADRNKIARLKKGVYFRAKNTIFGITEPNIDNVLIQILTIDGEEVIGYETGASFLNQIGLTTLIPRVKEIATNGYRRKIDPNCHIVTKKPVVKITTSNYMYLQILDALQGLQTSHIDANNPYLIVNEFIVIHKLDRLKLISFAWKYYNQRTIQKLLEVIFEVNDENS